MEQNCKIRVFVNLLCFRSEHLTGVGFFARRLFLMLDDRCTEGMTFELFYPAHLAVEKVFSIHPKLDVRLHPVRCARSLMGRIVYEQLVLPFRCKRCDVFYSPVPSVPLLLRWIGKKIKIIPTIHDLIYLSVPKKYPFFRRQYLTFLNRFSAQVAHKIVTVSEHSRQDLQRFLNVPAKKIVLVYTFLPEQKKRETPEVFEKYFLYIGTLEPGKNIENMLRGFHLLLQREGFSDYRFVLIGKEGWHFSSIYRLCEELDLVGKVHFTGYISSDEKEDFLRRASALVLVSFYEGFGAPILEGLYAHKPCVVSDTSALPEVAGKAGIYCRPDDIHSIASALQEVVERRDDLLLHIPEQLYKFDPQVQIRHFLQTLVS